MKNLKKALFITVATFFSVASFAGQSDWCEKATGHFGKADFGDSNSHIILTVTNGADANSFVVKMKAAADNAKGLSYMRAYCPQASSEKEVIVGQVGATSTLIEGELTANFTVPANVTTASLDLQWSNPTWGGTWCMGTGVTDGCASISIDMSNLSCGGECELTQAPTIASVSEGEVTPYSIALNVVATDEKGNAITKYVVEGEGIPNQTLTASDGVISIANLIPNTSYNISINAKDACGNLSAAQTIQVATASRQGDCNGQLGHYGNPDVKKIAYSIAYSEGKVIYTVTPVDPSLALDFCEIQQSVGGNYGMTLADDGKSATYETSYDAAVVMVRFLYSFDNMEGNEMTAEFLTSPEAVYYIVGECAAEADDDNNEGTEGGEDTDKEEEGEGEGDSTAVEDVQSERFSMYPNPTESNVNIVSEKVMKRIEVRAQNGQVVMEVYPNSTCTNLNVSNLAKGRYMVTIYNNVAYQTETIMVR